MNLNLNFCTRKIGYCNWLLRLSNQTMMMVMTSLAWLTSVVIICYHKCLFWTGIIWSWSVGVCLLPKESLHWQQCLSLSQQSSAFPLRVLISACNSWRVAVKSSVSTTICCLSTLLCSFLLVSTIWHQNLHYKKKYIQYRKPSINTANGSCMFGMLFESVLIEVKNEGVNYNESWKIKYMFLIADFINYITKVF